MTVETLKGLTLVEGLTTPIPTSVNDYIQTNLATGTGPFGTPTVYDFLGTAAGVNVSDWINQVNSGLALLDLTNLKAVYDNMLSCVQGNFGPVTGPVNIPSGPGAGAYATGDLAFTNGLIPAAAAEIASLVAANPDITASLNQSFENICAQIETEAINQSNAGINYDDFQGAGQQAILSFVSGLPVAAQNNTPGGPVQFLTDIADTSVLTGQAILGAIREGNNQAALTNIGVDLTGFNISPDYPGNPDSTGTPEAVSSNQDLLPSSSLGEPLVEPTPVEYQTPENPTSTSYTVAQAQQIISPLIVPVPPAEPTVVSILGVYQQLPAVAQTTTLLQKQAFWMQIKAQPSDPNTSVTVKNINSDESVTYGPRASLNSNGGELFSVPAWLLRDTGAITLNVTTDAPGTGDSITIDVVANNYPKSITVVQDGWFNQENVTVYGNTVTVTFRGPPSTSFNWTTEWTSSGWPTGASTFDSNGYRVFSGLPTPPVSNRNVIWVQYQTGEKEYKTFETLPV
jgi:hypothetical protein